MTDDLTLFGDLPETVTPREAWARGKGITCEIEDPKSAEPWTARIASHDLASSGESRAAAILNLATRNNIPGWEQHNWDDR